MPVKIRLTRVGKKKQPSYRVVVVDSRKPRDGKYIEQIGRYDARQEPSLVEIDNERALDWLRKGAQPTDRARKLLEISGAWAQFRVDKGEIHTIGEHRPQEYPEIAEEADGIAESGEESVEQIADDGLQGEDTAPDLAEVATEVKGAVDEAAAEATDAQESEDA